MAFVRIDLQLTEEESILVAEALKPVLNGFGERYDEMLNSGPDDGKHMTLMYRSRPVQNEMDRQDQIGSATS